MHMVKRWLVVLGCSLSSCTVVREYSPTLSRTVVESCEVLAQRFSSLGELKVNMIEPHAGPSWQQVKFGNLVRYIRISVVPHTMSGSESVVSCQTTTAGTLVGVVTHGGGAFGKVIAQRVSELLGVKSEEAAAPERR